jgi:DNA-binding response OmpR family regulator
VDDYMVKPFSPKELLARIKVIARRNGQNTKDRPKNDHYTYEGLLIDFDGRKVLVDGNTVNLTPKNFDLLNFFVENQNRVFSREQLLNQVWGFDFYGEDRTVDTHVKMLRESLGNYRNLIVTAWGTGYKFETGDRK